MTANQLEIFPRKLVLITISFLMLVLFLLLGVIYSSYSNFDKIKNVDFPVVENSSIAIRLNHEISYEIELLLLKKDLKLIESIEEKKQLLMNSLKELNTIGQEKVRNELNEVEVMLKLRNELDKLENQIIKDVENNRTVDALEIFKSKKHDNYKNNFDEVLSEIVNKRANVRDAQLYNVKKLLMLSLILFFICILLILFSFKKVYDQSLKNHREKLYYEQKLSHEKENSLQIAMLNSLTEMAAGIAHEVNNPLTVILMSLEKMIKKHESAEEVKSLEKVKMHSLRISKIVKGLKELTNYSSNEPKFKMQLSDLVDEAMLFYEYKFKSIGVEIKYDSPEIGVYGQRTIIVKSFIQFLSYLLKKMEDHEAVDGREILIHSKKEANKCVLKYEVNEAFVTNVNFELINNPVFSIEGESTNQYLWVYLIKKMLESNNGKFSVNKKDKYIEFEFILET